MIDTLINIAKTAGDLILEIYHQDNIGVETKEDASPLTEADLKSSAYIITELEKNFSYPVISEEGSLDYSERAAWPRYWLVDPLDGTKNFIHRDGQFTVNIALIEDGCAIAGVVHVPTEAVTYFAEKNKGAFKEDHSGRHEIINQRSSKDLISVTSVFHDTPDSAAFCKLFDIDKKQRYGSSVKLCKLAEGSADVYPRFVPTKEWDTAAAHCIVNEANCKIIDIETGKELQYTKDSIINNGFIASRNDLSFVEDPRFVDLKKQFKDKRK